MPENLPALAGDPNVLLAALAKAAAELAAQEGQRRKDAAPLDRDAIEEIARECVREAFRQFGIDLADVRSVEEHRENIAHLRRSRRWWEKAGGTIVGGVVTAMVGGVIAAIVKYLALGGVK